MVSHTCRLELNRWVRLVVFGYPARNVTLPHRIVTVFKVRLKLTNRTHRINHLDHLGEGRVNLYNPRDL